MVLRQSRFKSSNYHFIGNSFINTGNCVMLVVAAVGTSEIHWSLFRLNAVREMRRGTRTVF